MDYASLLEEIRRNNWFAEQTLFDHVRKHQFEYLSSAFRDQARAEEAFQCLMLDLFVAIRKDKIEHPDGLLLFSYRIAARLRGQEFDRREKEVAKVIPFSMLPEGTLERIPAPEDQERDLLNEELRRTREKEFKKALGILGDDERKIVRLYLKGVSDADGSRMFRISVPSLRQKRQVALEKVRRAIARKHSTDQGEWMAA